VTTQKTDEGLFTTEQIFNQRMQDCFWGIGEKTPNRKNLKKGNKVVFYMASPQKVFAGTATLNSSCFMLNDSQKNEYSHGKEFYSPIYGVLLKDIEIWSTPKPVLELLPYLQFIDNKRHWGSYFQGGVRQLEKVDFEVIINESILPPTNQSKIDSQAEFALETHLEDFIYKNWEKINWGSKLELYKTEEQDGRQFPAGIWSIDLLALDKNNNDFVVIELKKGKTSDTTVGQISRYISWIKKYVAEASQNVRGIIIAKDVDEALKYAVMDMSNIEIKTYQVNFFLQSFEK